MNNVTHRSFADLKLAADEAKSPKVMPARLDRLLAYIAYYQDMNHGETPTVATMATEMDVTDQTIRYYLGVLESQDRIHRIGFNPLRVMVRERAPDLDRARERDDFVRGVSKPHMPPAVSAKEKRERFEAVDAKRMRLLRFIGEHWLKHGQGPGSKAMMDAIGVRSLGHLQGMLSVLEKRGLVSKPGSKERRQWFSTRLTDAGEIVVGLRGKLSPADAAGATDTTNKSKEEVMETSEKKGGRAGRRMGVIFRDPAMAYKKIAVIIDEYWAAYHTAPSLKVIAEKMGYKSSSAISRLAVDMVERAWISHEHGNKRDLKLTDLGREVLLDKPEPEAEAPAPEAPPPAVQAAPFYPEALSGPDTSSAVLEELAATKAALAATRAQLAEVLTTPVAAAPAKMEVADMILALIEQGYVVRRA